jgi:hypothetical protein
MSIIHERRGRSRRGFYVTSQRSYKRKEVIPADDLQLIISGNQGQFASTFSLRMQQLDQDGQLTGLQYTLTYEENIEDFLYNVTLGMLSAGVDVDSVVAQAKRRHDILLAGGA